MKNTARRRHHMFLPGILVLGFLVLFPLNNHAAPENPPTCSWAEPILATRAKPAETPTAKGNASPAKVKPFETGPMPGKGPAKQVSLDIKGQRWLRLVGTVKQGTGNCHIWGDARLVAADGKVTRLCDLKPVAVNVGWGELLTNQNWQKHPLKVADRQFDHGVWVHADSDICYELAGKYERFEAWVGLDADRATGAAEFKVHFDAPNRRARTANTAGKTASKLVMACPGMKAFLAIPAHAGLQAEWAHQFAALEHDLRNRGGFAKVASETFRPESLVHESDRDPADVVVRRVVALLNDLKRMPGAPSLAWAESDMAALREAAAAVDVEDADLRYALFADACRLRRRVAFSNPLLNFDELVFIKHHRALMNHMCDQYYGMCATPGGGLYVLSDVFGTDPKLRDVLTDVVVGEGRLKGTKLTGGPTTPPNVSFDGMGNRRGTDGEGGAFLSPDLSYDGKQIAFAFVECKGDMKHRHHTDPSQGHWHEGRCYHVFKVNVDGTELVQLTDGTWNEFDPCWLPNGRIAFISERRGGYLRCGRACPLYNLYDMAADGSDISCLSFHESNEWHPSVTHDGRIIWTRWDYVDRHGCVAHMPWITTMDGRDPRPLHGNYAPRPSRADMELDCQAIPGSHKYVATATPHHGQAYGSLIIIDPHVADDDGMGPVRRITPDVGFPETQRGYEAYGTPWPLSEDYHLCVYDAEIAITGKRGRGTGNYGIYLVDSFGNRELLYRDPEIGCLSPIPLRARSKPHVPTEMVQFGRETDPAARAAMPKGKEPKPGTIAVMNVYDSLMPFPEGTRITALRVMQLFPMSAPSGGIRPHETGQRLPSARDSVVPVRHVLGTVPVEKDGSAHFTVPANKEIFFQALDENGLAVQSMRSGTHLHQGETLTCAGCHEPKTQVVRPPLVMAMALRREPSRLQPDVDGSRPFSFPRLVQPVLDEHCVACHAKNPKKAPNLAAQPIQRNWFTSYANLLKRGVAFNNYGGGYRTTPGKFGAHASKLYAMLKKGHHDVKLSPEEMHRITLWLDCGSMFYGVYEKETGLAQLRGEVAFPTLE